MKKIVHFLLLLVLATTLLQCRKEPSFTGNPDPAPFVITPSPITASLQGNVVDENNQPAAGVSVTVGSLSAVTNANGQFIINNAALDKKYSLVKAAKDGYFKAIRLFAATPGTNYLSFKLIKKTLTGTITAANGGTVSLSNGSNILLPANGIITTGSNSNYSGTINVYAAYIDPSAPDIANNIPGSFKAIDKNGKEAVLRSFGMLAVEMESASGEKLQLKTGSTATLTAPIPAAALSSAPASIPLWYMDETTGLWREDGSGNKVGSNYTGTVSHFTVWNFDQPYQTVNLSLKLITAGNAPVAFARVSISSTIAGWPTMIYGYTDALGNITLPVPANESLLLEISDPCENNIYSQNIAALSRDTDLGNITVNPGNSAIATVKGKLLNCANQPVTNGFALVSISNVVHYAATNATGDYETSFLICQGSSATVEITAVDNGNGAQQSTRSTVNLNIPITVVPNIITCGATALGYVNFSLDGVNYSYSELAGDNIDGTVRDIGGGTMVTGIMALGLTPGFRQFALDIKGTSAGTFPLQDQNSFGGSEIFPESATSQYSIAYLPDGLNSATITNYANNIGEYFEGSFSCRYTYSFTGPTEHLLNCSFRAQRKQ